MPISRVLEGLPMGATRIALAAAVFAVGVYAHQEAVAAKPATQVAARVNKEEISVHQINFTLQRTPGVTPDNADAVSRQVLDRLISQELAVQQAQDLKLDRNPAVMQALEAARREVLARAYFEKVGEGVARPTPAEITEFYNKRPALFKERKVYSLLDVNVATDAAQAKTVREQAGKQKTPKDFVEWLRGSGLKHQVGQANQAAESLPLDLLDRIAAIPDGQGIVMTNNNGTSRVLFVLQSQKAAVDEATARPAIERFILNDRRRQKVESDLKALRASSKVELMGKFAEGPPLTGSASPADTGLAPATSTASPASTEPQVPSAENVSRGLGLR